MKQKNGISLIVLVLTIIVMIILAGVIILSLSDTDIIGKANNAVDLTNQKELEQLATLAWSEAYLKETNVEKTDAWYKEEVIKAIEAQGLDAESYGFAVTAKGVEAIGKGWVQSGTKVTKGREQELEIGSIIKYDAGVASYTGNWKLLGAENGKLLIIMDQDAVSTFKIPENAQDGALEPSQQAWLNAEQILDEACKPYGNGEGAESVRCLRESDVSRILKYNPATYDKGEICEYGNELTFTYDATTHTASYTSTNGVSGTCEHNSDQGFYYYDGTDFKLATDSSTPVKAKMDLFAFAGSSETIGEEAYDMLFKDPNKSGGEAYYWVASRYTGFYNGTLISGIRAIGSGGISGTGLWNSHGGNKYGNWPGLRAVVVLSDDFDIESAASDVTNRGIYYVGVTSKKLKDYTGATAVYTAKDGFPDTVNPGDVYVYGDYEYRYNYHYNGAVWSGNGENGWGVLALNKTQTSYDNILLEINGAPVERMFYTYYNCTKLVDASNIVIPDSVIHIQGLFQGSTLLEKVPVIPAQIKRAKSAFNGCSALKGPITVHAELTEYENFIYGTQVTEILGDTTLKTELLATK